MKQETHQAVPFVRADLMIVKSPDVVVISAKPYNYSSCFRVDCAHSFEVVTLLRLVRLVNANGVGLEPL
jgi:hypothetical protein